MTTYEDELARALGVRMELLTGVAWMCLRAAGTPAILDSERDYTPADELHLLDLSRFHVQAAEALTAAVYVRNGVSWDVLSSRLEVSRQALHQRLAARGEALYAAAQRYPSVSSRVAKFNVDVLGRELTPVGRAELLMSPRRAAHRVAALRKVPRWWEARQALEDETD